MKKIKIALLSGGISGEREVSLNTGKMIFKALDKEKYDISQFDPKTDLKEFINEAMDRKFDLVFPALHGPFGEDGKLQGMLDMIDVPYVFSDCLASALAMHKHKTKVLAKLEGLAIAPDKLIFKNGAVDTKRVVEEFGLPVVIKPVELGSSVGISIAKTEEELVTGINEAFRYDNTILLEKFIKGRELTAAVMGNFSKNNLEALPIIEIIPKSSEWFDYKAKYEPGASEEVCPADIPEEIKLKIQDHAKRIYSSIGCKDIARSDFIWNKDDNKLYFLEINTIPGMTATSLAPQAAKEAGLEFSEFLDKLISYNL